MVDQTQYNCTSAVTLFVDETGCECATYDRDVVIAIAIMSTFTTVPGKPSAHVYDGAIAHGQLYNTFSSSTERCTAIASNNCLHSSTVLAQARRCPLVNVYPQK